MVGHTILVIEYYMDQAAYTHSNTSNYFSRVKSVKRNLSKAKLYENVDKRINKIQSQWEIEIKMAPH